MLLKIKYDFIMPRQLINLLLYFLVVIVQFTSVMILIHWIQKKLQALEHQVRLLFHSVLLGRIKPRPIQVIPVSCRKFDVVLNCNALNQEENCCSCVVLLSVRGGLTLDEGIYIAQIVAQTGLLEIIVHQLRDSDYKQMFIFSILT